MSTAEEIKAARKKYIKDLTQAGIALRQFSDQAYTYAIALKDSTDLSDHVFPVPSDSGFALCPLVTPGEAAAKKRKSRAKDSEEPPKDPNAPKKPATTAYALFRQAIEGTMKKEGLEPKVLTQTCKDQWKAFSKEDKAPFIDAAEKAKAKYEEALARYEAGNKDVAAPDIDVQDLLDQVKPALPGAVNSGTTAAAIAAAKQATADSDSDDESGSSDESDSDGSEDSVDAALVPARKQARLTLEEDDGQ